MISARTYDMQYSERALRNREKAVQAGGRGTVGGLAGQDPGGWVLGVSTPAHAPASWYGRHPKIQLSGMRLLRSGWMDTSGRK